MTLLLSPSLKKSNTSEKSRAQGKYSGDISKLGRVRTRLYWNRTGVRPQTTAESLGKLRAAFKKDGIVTAGNAPGLTDGASALVVTSRAFAEGKGLPILATIKEYASAHLDPKDVFPCRLAKSLFCIAEGPGHLLLLAGCADAPASALLPVHRTQRRAGYLVLHL